jgi:hypothetical protein
MNRINTNLEYIMPDERAEQKEKPRKKSRRK